MTGAYEITEEYERAKYKHRGDHDICRYKNGTHCKDCGKFFENDSDEYLRCDGISDLFMVINNILVEHQRSRSALAIYKKLLYLSSISNSIKTDGNWRVEIEELRIAEKEAILFAKKYRKNSRSARVSFK